MIITYIPAGLWEGGILYFNISRLLQWQWPLSTARHPIPLGCIAVIVRELITCQSYIYLKISHAERAFLYTYYNAIPILLQPIAKSYLSTNFYDLVAKPSFTNEITLCFRIEYYSRNFRKAIMLSILCGFIPVPILIPLTVNRTYPFKANGRWFSLSEATNILITRSEDE